MKFTFIKPQGLWPVDLVKLAVDADADEALPPDFLEDVPELALGAADNRRQHDQRRADRMLQKLVDDLLDRPAAHRFARLRAMRLADVRKKKAQVVVNLCRRRDCRSRVEGGGPLFDRDGRRQAIDVVDLRLLHLVEELPGVRGEALDVLALAFREDGVEGE